MQLLLTQLIINITVRALAYMAICFDPHFNNLQANISHKINYKCMLNLYVDIMTSQPIL